MTAAQLQNELSRRIGAPVAVRLNDNTRTLVSARRDSNGAVRASIHRMFLDAPPDVVRALAQFLKRPTPASRRDLRVFMANHSARPGAIRPDLSDPSNSSNRPDLSAPSGPSGAAHPSRSRRPRPGLGRLETVGRAYDLGEIAARLNRVYFGGRLDFAITWGRRPPAPPKSLSTLQLGVWIESRRTIRVHPILDTPRVPAFFVEYIVYHEMCHIAVPHIIDPSGRVLHHPPAFNALERRFPRYAEAAAWLKNHLDDMISWYCSRPPRRAARQLTLF